MGQGFAMIFGVSKRHLLDLDAKGRYAALDEEFSPSKSDARWKNRMTRRHEADSGIA